MFANPLCGFLAGKAKVDGKVGVGNALSQSAIIPFFTIASSFQNAEAIGAEAQVGGKHFLLSVIQDFPGEAEGFCLILFQQRLVGLRVGTDRDLLPAVLWLAITGSVAAVDVGALHVLQSSLDQFFCFGPVPGPTLPLNAPAT